MGKKIDRSGPSTPQESSSETDIDRFLQDVRSRRPTGPNAATGRLIFAMDATASRQPSWDRACSLQGDMFSATASIGGLAVQLVFYRGYKECKASKWTTNALALARIMGSVACMGGQTQVGRVLAHTLKEHKKAKVDALVFVGDCFEENIDTVCHQAGELGVNGVPAFVFQEGYDPAGMTAFKEIARLTGGAHCPFDAGSAKQLRELLAAVAIYATGGKQAMLDYGKHKGGVVQQLTHQVGKPRGKD